MISDASNASSKFAKGLAALCLLLSLWACERPTSEPGPTAPASDSSAYSAVQSKNPDVLEIVILHTNDIHGQVFARPDRSRRDVEGAMRGGFPALARLIRRERAKAEKAGKHVLLLDGGDQYQGTPEGNLTRGRIVVDFMNAVGYTAGVIGNHEYDYGKKVPAALAQQMSFPFLGANAHYHNTGRRVSYLTPYLFFTIEDLPVLIIGLTTSEMKNVTIAECTKGLTFEREELTVKAVLDELGISDKGQALTMILSHIGLDRDKELAEAFPVLDVIVGGHSHTRLEKAQKVGDGDTLVAQAHDKTKVLGKIELKIDRRSRKVLSAKGALLPVHTEKLGEDEDIKALIAKYTPAIEKQMAVVHGQATEDIGRVREPVSSPLGNMVTDAMRLATGAQVAFQNKPGMRMDILKGAIRERNLFEVSPFGNTLVTMELTGAQIKRVMESCLGSDHSFFEISGMTCVHDSRRARGKRVVSLKIDGQALDPKARYRIVTNSYLAQGGDKAGIFKHGRAVKKLPMTLRSAVRMYVLRTKTIKPDWTRRLDDLAQKEGQ